MDQDRDHPSVLNQLVGAAGALVVVMALLAAALWIWLHIWIWVVSIAALGGGIWLVVRWVRWRRSGGW